jgi:hypothetical protein
VGRTHQRWVSRDVDATALDLEALTPPYLRPPSSGAGTFPPFDFVSGGTAACWRSLGAQGPTSAQAGGQPKVGRRDLPPASGGTTLHFGRLEGSSSVHFGFPGWLIRVRTLLPNR